MLAFTGEASFQGFVGTLKPGETRTFFYGIYAGESNQKPEFLNGSAKWMLQPSTVLQLHSHCTRVCLFMFAGSGCVETILDKWKWGRRVTPCAKKARLGQAGVSPVANDCPLSRGMSNVDSILINPTLVFGGWRPLQKWSDSPLNPEKRTPLYINKQVG